MTRGSVGVWMLVVATAGCDADTSARDSAAPTESDAFADSSIRDTEIPDTRVAPDTGPEMDASDTGDAAEVISDTAPPPKDDVEPPSIRGREVPCDRLDHWPFTLSSGSLPLHVHYERASERGIAAEVLRFVETSWTTEVGWGFRPPAPDGGACGPDGGFDVFLWKGQEEAWVAGLDEIPATPHDDWLTYMVVDPWGPYGGDLMGPTVSHELNHACQAADDWWDSPIAFEMTSTFVEARVFPNDDWMFVLEDFQAHADWGIDLNDDYETWFMYGAALYLHYLSEAHFDGRAAFAGAMWLGLRSPPGAADNPAKNEPDFIDSLDDVLADAGRPTYLETVVEFARWRWLVASRDDGRHFADGAVFPDESEPPLSKSAAVSAGSVTVSPGPMVLGTVYVEVTGAAGQTLTVTAAAPGAEAVAWAVQPIPTATEALPSGGIAASVATTIPAGGARVLAVTALPVGAHDPDTRGDERVSVTLSW